MTHHDNLHDDDFGPVIDRLQSERPTASTLELDLIKQRVHSRVARSARRSRRTEFMRSRLAILAMLVSGLVLSTGGGALAVSGFASQDQNAATSQYGGGPAGGVLGEDESGGPAGGTENNGGGGGANEAQPARQVESGAQGTGGEQLPFTGFAAIPVLLGGVALLGTGLVMRRRIADEE